MFKIKLNEMKNLKLLFLVLPFLYLNSQELDKNFLDSLPEDVRQDVLERAQSNQESTINQYRPSQYSSKLEQAEELIKLKMRIEKDLLELDRRLKTDEKLELPQELELFGSDFYDLSNLLYAHK